MHCNVRKTKKKKIQAIIRKLLKQERISLNSYPSLLRNDCKAKKVQVTHHTAITKVFPGCPDPSKCFYKSRLAERPLALKKLKNKITNQTSKNPKPN